LEGDELADQTAGRPAHTLPPSRPKHHRPQGWRVL